MAKGSRKKCGKSKNYSTLEQHKREGKTLVPPLMQVGNVHFNSWAGERLPEFLWAVLLVSGLSREEALAIFRGVVNYWQDVPESAGPIELSQSGLAAVDQGALDEFLVWLCRYDRVRRALAPLALLEHLPARHAWLRTLQYQPDDLDWEHLKSAVARAFDHQSQEATDCRWLRLVYLMISGRVKFPISMREMVEEILEYPSRGDMRAVRPSIRSMEGALTSAFEAEQSWANAFWDQCLADSECVNGQTTECLRVVRIGTSRDTVRDILGQLRKHCGNTRGTTAIDPKHDAAFGLSLYAVSILDELLMLGVSTSILGRMALRALTEVCITMAYLAKKDSADLWKTYRNYGAGQAKLAYLKLDQSTHLPSYVSPDTLRMLANEDMWQEFVSIELGNWEKTNLRIMSEEAGAKAEYDSYFQWTSGYVHAHWGAVRDSVYASCLNPLHRFHRVPRETVFLDDVIPDAARLVDKTLAIVDSLYPTFAGRVSEEEIPADAKS